VTSRSSERAPDANAFPFAELLAELRQRGFGIGLREYNDVAKLASRWTSTDRATFRNALAAVLARNAAEVDRIQDVFDEWADAEPSPEPLSPRRQRLRTWHIVAIALLLACAAGTSVWLLYERMHRKPPVADVSPPPAETTHDQTPTKPAPELPDPPYQPASERPWIAAGVAALIALVALAVRRTRSTQRQWARRYWRHVLAQQPGTHHYEQKVIHLAPPLPRADLEEMATILGRARETDPSDGDVLDADESLRLTLHAGLAPHLVFKPPPRSVPILVLQDTSWQMRPFQRRIDYLVAELRRQGVPLERWYFDGDPLFVSRSPYGRSVPLAAIAPAYADASLLIFSTGQAVPADSINELDRMLKKWYFRTWLHPVANPEYWRPDLALLRETRMWPMTRAGMRAAAVEISRKGDTGFAPRMARPHRVTQGDIERVKQLIALVPHPTLELAEELRRRFAPEVPDDVLLFLGAEGVFHGETITLPPEQLKRLLDTASIDPEREQKVRRYLLEVLRDSKPPAESAAYLRWQLDEAVHRLKLGDADARTTLADLAAGPLREEVRAALSANDLDVRVDPNPPKVLPIRPPEFLGNRPPVWRWPNLGSAAIVLFAIAALVLIVRRGQEFGRGEPIQHLRGAYTLSFTDDRYLVMDPAPGVPAGVDRPSLYDVYRDGKYVQSLSADSKETIELRDDERGSWYELRATLAKGNLATSYPIWVPARIPPEMIDDDISRRVVKIVADITRVPETSIKPSTLLREADIAALTREVRGSFSIEIPRSDSTRLTTVGQLVDYVRRALGDDALSQRIVALVGRYLTAYPRVHADESLWTNAGGDEQKLQQLFTAIESEFPDTLSEAEFQNQHKRSVTDFVVFVRDRVNRQTRPATLTLRFVWANGAALGRVAYEVFGSGRTYRGFGGVPLSIPPGAYRVTVRLGGIEVLVQRIAPAAGESYTRRFAVSFSPIYVTKPMIDKCVTRGGNCTSNEGITIAGVRYTKGIFYTQSFPNPGSVLVRIPAGASSVSFTVGNYFTGANCIGKAPMMMSINVDGQPRWAGRVDAPKSSTVRLSSNDKEVLFVGESGDGLTDCDDSVWANVVFR